MAFTDIQKKILSCDNQEGYYYIYMEKKPRNRKDFVGQFAVRSVPSHTTPDTAVMT